jgi:hypothetical protein
VSLFVRLERWDYTPKSGSSIVAGSCNVLAVAKEDRLTDLFVVSAVAVQHLKRFDVPDSNDLLLVKG